MSKLQHTPGPWEIVKFGDAYEIRTDEYDVVTASLRKVIRKESDARLIAAAPEMLEELIDFCRYRCSGCTGMTEGCSGECGSNVKTLIEKITGLSIEEVLAE